MRYQLRHIRTAPRLAVAHRVARMNISRRRTWNTNRGPETGFHLHGRPDPGFCGPARTGPPDACRHGTGTAPTRLRRLADPELGPRVRLATVFRCRSGDRATRGPIAQWKSAPFTPERSLVRTQLGPHRTRSLHPGDRETGAAFVSGPAGAPSQSCRPATACSRAWPNTSTGCAPLTASLPSKTKNGTPCTRSHGRPPRLHGRARRTRPRTATGRRRRRAGRPRRRCARGPPGRRVARRR